VRDRSLRRRLSELGWNLAHKAFTPGPSGLEVAAEAEAEILQITESVSTARLEPIGDVVDATVEAVEDEPPGRLPELRWGLAELDRILGGGHG